MTLAELAYVNSTGFHVADYPAYLEYLQDKYRTIYGEDVYLEPDSQDGQWVAIQARALYDTAILAQSIYNSFSPVGAQGTGLSRNVKINGLERRAATKSTVDLTIIGQAGTTIVDGVAEDSLNQKWDIPSPTVIPSGGEIIVTATAQEDGAVLALPDTITKIFTPTLGWQTVNNVDAASPGVAVETDAELRARQAISTANPSLTVMEGTVGAVGNIDGVTKLRGYENDTSSTDANGIPEHSICLVVQGGDSTDIAETIALHKTPGTGTYGDVSVPVTDSKGMPLTIKFQRPTNVTITATITIAAGPDYNTAMEDQIKEAIADYINALQIGANVLITKLYAPAYLNGTVSDNAYDIVTLEIGKDSDPQSDVNIPLDFDETAICVAATDVTVIVT